ncbi:MAG TPA: FlgD immunoglobulin-like domain containing protein [Gaiellaceae bacterium]|nr:FlgD immunoglobulin-like domain containing protein [Gaiellaceae bacterium]
MQRVLTTVTLLGLLVATAAAFAITEHLKLEKSPIFGTKIFSGQPGKPALFSPVCGQGCATRTAEVRLRLRRTGHVTVTIADSDGHRVATIAPDVVMQAKIPRTFRWDGRTDAGALAPDGVYYPWVQLGPHVYKFINKITLDTVPPQVLKAAAVKPKPVLFAGRGQSVAIRYEFSERAHPVVYLDGRRIIVGRHIRPSARIKWGGKLEGRPLPAGKYVLSIGALDRAGNETPAGKRMDVPVVLRYVELTPALTTVRAGRRFKVHVETAARRYIWRLGQRHGERRGRTLRLRAPTTPGTYRLVVTANGHATTAVVRVRAK